jgi:hypothetical protein
MPNVNAVKFLPPTEGPRSCHGPGFRPFITRVQDMVAFFNVQTYGMFSLKTVCFSLRWTRGTTVKLQGQSVV